MDQQVYCSPGCGKIEFFQAERNCTSEDGIETSKCPQCEKIHDGDCSYCPFCKYDYCI